jgi:hypothetical protein
MIGRMLSVRAVGQGILSGHKVDAEANRFIACHPRPRTSSERFAAKNRSSPERCGEPQCDIDMARRSVATATTMWRAIRPQALHSRASKLRGWFRIVAQRRT